MHLMFLSRGIKQDVDRMVMNLESLYLPFEINGKTCNVQANLQPIQLWSLVFPTS